MPSYLYNRPDWPNFTWDEGQVVQPLSAVRFRQGQLLGRMDSLGFDLQQAATQTTLTQEIVKSSEIEGVRLDPEDVRSSIGQHLGLSAAGLRPTNRYIDGIVEMMLEATGEFRQPLTASRIWHWHELLFPTRHNEVGLPLTLGAWRTDAAGPMQVVSGAIGRERVHFTAPPAADLPDELERFFAWFEAPGEQDWLLKAALAHLWFVTLHPLDDGNGRIARTIAELALCRSDQSSLRFYGMSDQIRKDRRQYYEILERTERGSLDVTGWMLWFLGCLDRALAGSELLLERVLLKARYRRLACWAELNSRQREVISRMIDEGLESITARIWSTRSNYGSKDAALADIQELLTCGVLAQNPGGGRSTSYRLLPPDDSGSARL